MKKIIIAGSYRGRNYGSRLQATALSEVFKAQGYDVYYICHFHVPSFLIRHPSLIASRVINKLTAGRRNAFFQPSPYQASEARMRRLDAYFKENLSEISINSSALWQKIINERAQFVIGSDIIWQPANGIPAIYFVDFAYFTDLNRFSYATSIGATELPKKYYRYYKKYLGAFSKIGVREEAAARLLETIVGKPVTKVLDPTLLLTAEKWDALADKAEISVQLEKKGFVLCYFVMDDPRYWEYVKTVQRATGLQFIVLPMHYSDEKQPYSIILDGTPYEFVWLVKHAQFVLTDSFHACAFSLMYNKEFYLLSRTRKAEDDKYNDFLTRYHLTDRKVTDESTFVRMPDVDYTYANAKLEEDRAFSYAFIREALQK